MSTESVTITIRALCYRLVKYLRKMEGEELVYLVLSYVVGSFKRMVYR